MNMKTNTMKMLCGVLCAVVAQMAASATPGDVADPRVRTYVSPKRIVWKASVADKRFGVRMQIEDEDKLLLLKHGQVPEGGANLPPFGCLMVNSGEKPGILIDFGREIHGGLQIGSGLSSRHMKLRVRFGESAAEAMSEIGEKGSTNDHAVRDTTVMLPLLGSCEIGNTGFRFVRIDLETTGKAIIEYVRAVELMRPMERVGSFRSSDDRLNRVWDTAVRTVHLCCQDYLWDGIKRDRLVWMGDMHPETLGILTVFGADRILPESIDLMAAVTPPDMWMNKMGAYTLWWIRNLAEWYRYTGDREYLKKHATYLSATFDNLEKYITPSNTLEGIRRPFIDWPTEHNRPAVHVGMQALALMTWKDGVYLADAISDEKLSERCRRTAERLETLRGKLSPHGSKQAAALLALSGLADGKEMFDQVLGCDGTSGVSTFYGYYMLEAMCKAGKKQYALDTVRDYWGAMLDVGATSFWENFNVSWTNNAFRIDELPVPGKVDIHGDYGEFCYQGFRHSLCHGWSCGPAQWCINNILGIRPLDTGCRRVEVKPFLGDLEWAEGAMALPDGGRISVKVRKKPGGGLTAEIDAPDWVSISRD